MEVQPTTGGSSKPRVWRPGVDGMAEDEVLDYDPTAYDCLHQLSLEWPCLSFDMLRDGLGAPRQSFPHTLFMVAGTQAASAKQNYVSIMKITSLGQAGHGKKAGGMDSDDEDDDMDEEEDEEARDGRLAGFFA